MFIIIYCLLNVTINVGINPAASRKNFNVWLDAMMTNICPISLVVDNWGNRQKGWFQRMKLYQFTATAFLSATPGPWGVQCASAVPPVSCGKLYYIAGSGAGSLTMKHQVAGPFRT